MKKRAIIIGGGISGLAAAHRLAELARSQKQDWEITLLESSERLGGVIETGHRQDFILEGGPDCFISEKPWARELCERIGLGGELIETRQNFRRSFILKNGRLLEIPKGFYLTIPSNLRVLLQTDIFSWPGKFRMAADLFIPPKKNESDESVASFIRRRLGREAFERMGQPMIGGIYGGDPERLSMQATFPNLPRMEREFGSLMRGLAQSGRGHQAASGPRYSLFLSLKGGMETLVRRIREKMPEVEIKYSQKVVNIRPGIASLTSLARNDNAVIAPQGLSRSYGIKSIKGIARRTKSDEAISHWTIETQKGGVWEGDVVCFAIPAPHAAKLTASFAPELTKNLKSIAYESAATINLAYRQSDFPGSLNGFGFVVPELEKKNIIGCTFSSTKFSARSPEGFVLLRAFAGGAFHRDLFSMDDEALAGLVQRELKNILKLKSAPLWTWVKRYPESMPQYELGHSERVKQIKEEAGRCPGIFLTGNAYEGIGIPDCIHHSEKTAEQMADFLCGTKIYEKSSHR